VQGEARKAVLDLRLDPRAASLMAGEMTSEDAAYLRGRTGREPTGGELYAAHFLGSKGSAQLIEANRNRPDASAAALFPEAAAANPSIFYSEGRAHSVATVYANLTRGGSQAAAPAPSTNYLQYASDTRMQRLEQQRMLTDLILGTSKLGDSSAPTGMTGSLFSSEMLRVLSEAKDGGRSGGAPHGKAFLSLTEY
jgi:hypothetical protein